MRISPIVAAVCLLLPNAGAQAPGAGPLALLLPASTRAAGVGNAWVAGRDEYSVFYNPAQIYPTTGISASFSRYGWNGTRGAIAGAATVGTRTFGWGVHLVEFKARSDAAYPFVPADLTRRGDRNALSLSAGIGGNFVLKGFRAGIGLKYAEDRVEGADPSTRVLNGLLLGDVGVSRALFSGTAALSVQNIGDGSRVTLPIQTSLGWTRQVQAREFDLGFAVQVSERNRWLGAGGGVEVSYGWIEGFNASLRAGARRMETSEQRPFTLGGGLAADRLFLEYALESFRDSRFAHHLSVSWR